MDHQGNVRLSMYGSAVLWYAGWIVAVIWQHVGLIGVATLMLGVLMLRFPDQLAADYIRRCNRRRTAGMRGIVGQPWYYRLGGVWFCLFGIVFTLFGILQSCSLVPPLTRLS
jgi:hypothetical protein